MSLAYFLMLIHEFLNKDPYLIPEEYPQIILYSKSDDIVAKTVKIPSIKVKILEQ